MAAAGGRPDGSASRDVAPPGRRHNLQDLFLVPQAAAAQLGPSSSRTACHRRDTISTSRAVAVAGAAVFGRNGITSRDMAPPGRRHHLQDLFLAAQAAAAQSGPSSSRTPCHRRRRRTPPPSRRRRLRAQRLHLPRHGPARPATRSGPPILGGIGGGGVAGARSREIGVATAAYRGRLSSSSSSRSTVHVQTRFIRVVN